mgnify:CR=1 FL=1|tara:strand:- start:721 stop:864 length:144 start_codon:yes stop_codon:yes gene_type:complete
MSLNDLPPAKPLSERRKQPINTVPVTPSEPATVETTPTKESPVGEEE